MWADIATWHHIAILTLALLVALAIYHFLDMD